MRRACLLPGLSGSFLAGLLSTHAFAEEPAVTADQPATTEDAAAPAAPAAAAAPTSAIAPPAATPKFGDVSVSGYFLGGFGASNQGGRMTCFALANPAGLVSKYRLGNECEVWSETHFTVVTYVGDDGSVARLHVMPTAYIPTTYIGYSPTGVVNSPAQFSTSTGATLSFPTLYADITGVRWFGGGTVWIGTRYYKRESIYISDFFYWNPSGVGAGIEDIHLGKSLRLSYAAFAVDGEPAPPADASSPPLPLQLDFGVRHDLQLRGIPLWTDAELQIGVQAIVDLSNDYDANGNRITHGGWGATLQWVQKLLGGDNKLAVQYGRGGGTGFGTLARFYYPDFSVHHDLAESRLRVVDVFTVQPIDWLGGQVGLVYQHDDLGNAGQKTTWYSGGGRVNAALSRHFKLIGEAGVDYVKKSNGSDPQYLTKFTIAPAITGDRGFWARPELRLFYTYAVWNVAARTATVDSGRVYTDTNFLSGATFGLQAETSW